MDIDLIDHEKMKMLRTKYLGQLIQYRHGIKKELIYFVLEVLLIRNGYVKFRLLSQDKTRFECFWFENLLDELRIISQ